jgi:hypothetical protein
VHLFGTERGCDKIDFLRIGNARQVIILSLASKLIQAITDVHIL